MRRGPLLAAVAAVAIVAGGGWGWSWWDARRVPPGPPQEAGRILFSKKSCVRCHRIAGIGGRMGPDLTVLSLRRSPEWLERYIQDPRAVKPDARMPRPKLTPEQRRAVIAYLETLDAQAPPVPPDP